MRLPLAAGAAALLLLIPSSALAQGANAGGSGGGGGGGSTGGTASSPSCAAISNVVNQGGYGPYGGGAGDIKTKFDVKNCATAAKTYTARVTYGNSGFWGVGFDVPLSSVVALSAGGSKSVTTDERYVLLNRTYSVTIDIIDADGSTIASNVSSVSTPVAPRVGST